MTEVVSPKTHSLLLVDILRENNFKKFAEIGVWKGGTAARILKMMSDELDEYWAVDPWRVMDSSDPGTSRTQNRRTEWHWEQYHKYVCGLMFYFPQLKVLRMTSEEAATSSPPGAANIIPDGHLDMVYIDAIHTFEHVHADIGYWLPKVREGGIIGGHDYGGRRFPGVEEAVGDWFGEGIKVWELEGVWVKRV